MALDGASRRRRAGLFTAALLAITAALAAPREALSQPPEGAPSGLKRPDTIPTFPRPIRASRDVLESPLALRDTELGLGAGAQIRAAVDRIAVAQAPRRARGVLRVFVDDQGYVSSVTSTSPSWEAAASAVDQALRGRRFDLPSGARGVVLTFDVAARSTHVPAVLTGDGQQGSVVWNESLRGSSPSDAPCPVVVVPVQSLLPVPRHEVSVTLLHEGVR